MSIRPMRALLSCLMIVLVTLGAQGPARATPGAVLVTRNEQVPLLAQASPTASQLRSLPSGQRLLELRRRGDWVEVAVFGLVGVRGWVRSSAVVPEPAPAAGRAPPPPVGKGADAALPDFVLDISGTPALAFRATCQVVTSGGAKVRAEHAGLVPERIAVAADALSCRVRKEDAMGRLRVSLQADATRVAAAQTSAPFNWVRVRSDGPWGDAGGLRGSVGLVLPDRPEAPPRGPPIDSLPRPLPR